MERLAIDYVATVLKLWRDAEVIRNLDSVLESKQFELVELIELGGRTNKEHIMIYQNIGPKKNPPDDFTYELSTGDVVK